jgi:cytochrome P450
VFRSLHRMVSMTPSDSETFEQIRASFESSWGRLVEVVQARRAAPRDDVISHLVTHESPAFTDEQVEMMTMNVILGASHTTSSLLAQILIHLDDDPALRERLRNDLGLLPKAVEEFLRLKAVSISIGRTATRDIEVEGAPIKRGDRVLLAFAAANHDPARYADPTAFDLERGAAQHLGMGVGSHFCLGAWLAKSIVVNTLEVLFERLDHLAVDHDHVVVSPEVSNAYALEHVPATVVR